MHHKLDIHPIPENVLYINELSMVTEQVYETTKEVEQALTGKTVSNGGILPDDNIRIYVPMDLNMDEIMFRVYRLYSVLGYPTERNESEFSTKMEQIVSQLEIYDQVWTARDMEHVIQKGHPTVRHSQQGTALARKLIDYMETHDGCAECYPYDIIEELKSTFWLE